MIIKHKDLVRALAFCQHALINNGILPMMDSFIFQPQSNGVTIRTSNGNYYAVYELQATKSETGKAFPINGSKLMSFLKNCKEEEVKITVNKDQTKVNVKCGRTTFNFAYEDAEDFPVEPVVEADHIQIDNLFESISQAALFVSGDHLKPALQYVAVESDGIKSTNNHTLFWDKRAIELEDNFLINPKSLAFLSQMASPQISLNENKINYVDENARLYETRLNSKYVNIQSVFPDYDNGNPSVTLNRVDLFEIINSHMIAISGAKSGQTCFSFSDETKVTTLASLDTRSGADSTIVATMGGHGIDINFNPSYLHKAISSMSGEKVRLWITEKHRPVILKDTVDLDKEVDENPQIIVMPIMPTT